MRGGGALFSLSTRASLKLAVFSLFMSFAMIVFASIIVWSAGVQNIGSQLAFWFEAPLEAPQQILTVYQTINQTDPSWTKTGDNTKYTAGATKINKTAMSDLTSILNNKDSFGNIASSLYGADTYMNAPVYKDIDIANVDVATGEILGYLSDPNYPFEWFGRSVTLPAGTTLASGRTLTSSTTFSEVDCYTKFPTMYIRRYINNNVQYLSVSEESFSGAVKIDEFYVATFEARMIGADNKTRNYPRSFIPTNGAGPLTSGSISYAVSNYGITDSASIASTSTTQANMQKWMDNLTDKWKSSAIYGKGYKSAVSCQGENWKRDVINILYLIKYANNNSQEQVGYGCTYNYSASTVSSSYKYYDSEKGGGTVTTYSSSLAYGYNQTSYQNTHKGAGIDYVNSTDPAGLYATQFLVKNINDGTTVSKRVLLDGFVGTDKYTGVFCLGMCNLWGNVCEWTFGQTKIYIKSTSSIYTNFDDYDGSNWILSNSPSSVTASSSGYVELSYTLPSSSYYCYNGVSTGSGSVYESLVGLPTTVSSTASSTTGMCDYFYGGGTSTSSVYGVLRSGDVYSKDNTGLFFAIINSTLASTIIGYGFRASLVMG